MAEKKSHEVPPRWMTLTLRAAGIYNLAWGAWVVLRPADAFHWAGMPEPNYPELWQCIGMIVGVYGLGYWIAARDPARHWPIVLVGFLGKLFGPIGFLDAAMRGRLPWIAGWLGVMYGVSAALAGGWLLWHAGRFLFTADRDNSARGLFLATLVYLPFVLGALLIDRLSVM